MLVRRHLVAVTTPEKSLNQFALDVALVGRLEATRARMRKQDTRLTAIFYTRFFVAAPRLRHIFRDDPAAQAQKLVAALDAVVRNFEHPLENVAMLAQLGSRHIGRGTKPEHYNLVIDILITSMTELLGPYADGRGLDEWRMALRLISDHMIRGVGGASV